MFEAPSEYYIGLDIGQLHSQSALVVLRHVTEITNHRDPVTFEFIREERNRPHSSPAAARCSTNSSRRTPLMPPSRPSTSLPARCQPTPTASRRVPKADLFADLRYLLAHPRFHYNAGNATDLVTALSNIQHLQSGSGRAQFKSTGPDDLAMAFALAAWRARRVIAKLQT